MHKFFNLFLLLSFISFSSIAGNAIISGKVLDQDKTLSSVAVVLLNAKDSSWVKTELTDDKGQYTFSEVAIGNYLLSISLVGYGGLMKELAVKDAATYTTDILLPKSNGTLAEATVSAKRPLIEMGLGKLVVNVEGSSSAIGNNALELLRRLPGLSVDQAGNISMHGKQGVMVLINDRPTYLSEDQLAEYLKSMSAAEIAQLELVTQPGAKYDAAGNVGVINIKLKKNIKLGVSGNASLTLGQGVYSNEHGSLMLNYKKNKLNLSLNATDVHATGFADFTDNQYFTDLATGSVQASSFIHSTPKEKFSITTLRLSADYDLSDKTTIGISARGAYHPNDMTSHVFATRYDNITNTVTYNDILNPDGFIRKDVTTNAYLSHKFSGESSLDVNLDYLTYGNDYRQDFTNATLNDQMQATSPALMLKSKQESIINVVSAKVDYTYAFKNGIKLEAGAKSSQVKTDNDAGFNLLQNNNWVNDTSRSNRFVYKENINAVYAAAYKDLNDKWNARVGLRAEQTIADGLQHVHADHFTRNYLSLFPTAFIGYTADSNNQFELNYGRRIDRPGYKLLNPFIYYSFQYNYTAGNPYLQPQYTNSIELKHSYKNMIITSLSVAQTKDVMSEVVLADNATRIIYSTSKNVGENRMADLSMAFNKDVTQWWSLNLTADVYYLYYSGMVANNNIVNDGVGWNTSMFSQFDLGKGWRAEAQVYYSSKYVSSVMGASGDYIYTSAGVSKRIGDHINIKASLEDPFYLSKFTSHNVLNNFRSDSRTRIASQMAYLSFTYNFGNGQARQHNNALEEKGRMKMD